MDPSSQSTMPSATPFAGQDVWLSVNWSDATEGAVLAHEVYRQGQLVPELSDAEGKGLRIDATNLSGTTKWQLPGQQLKPGLHEAHVTYQGQVVAIKRFVVMEMPFGVQFPQAPASGPPSGSSQ